MMEPLYIVSFKKIAARENAKREYEAVARHGKKYGYFAQKGCEKTFGQRSDGATDCPSSRN